MKPRLKFLLSKSRGFSCLSLLSSRPRPPDEFLCPISDLLMTNPVNLPSGHTFDRPCIEAAIELLYYSNPNCPLVSSFHLTPDDNLKSTILNWCHNVRHPNPRPISQEEAHRFVERRMHLLHIFQSLFSKLTYPADVLDGNVSAPIAQKKDQEQPSSKSRISVVTKTVSNASTGGPLDMMKEILMKLEKEKLLSKAVPVKPPVSSSNSAKPRNSTPTSLANGVSEAALLEKLKHKEISIREEALTILFESVRISHDLRISLCNSRILTAVIPKLNPRHSPIQNMLSVSFIFIISAEPSNRVMIVQYGAISCLVGILKERLVDDALDIAASAFFSLSLEEKNRESIGSTLGAIAALVDYFSEPSGRHGGRKYAGLALDNLSDSCPDNISRLAEIAGAVKKLLGVANDRSLNLQRIAVVVICRVAWVSKGREELIAAGAIKEMVKIMVEGLWKEEEERDCLAVMYQICDHDEALFKELAIEAQGEEVLAQDKEGWGDVGREMAIRMLQVICREDLVEGQQEENEQSFRQWLP